MNTEVDFLIVTANEDEYKPFEELVVEQYTSDIYTLGKVYRINSVDYFTVALLNMNSAGNHKAQQKVTRAITRLSPKRVLLGGIAAGFGEMDVSLGDILVPENIVNYESMKIKEDILRKKERKSFFNRFRKSKVVEEHRFVPLNVSQVLFNAAKATAKNSEYDWGSMIKVNDPNNANNKPAVKVEDESIMGCGEAVVATTLAGCRKWLIEECNADGLEMEAYGAGLACRNSDIPFLMIKAVQDYAAGSKNDEYREYACYVAATFIISLIKTFELEDNSLLYEHTNESREIAMGFIRDRFKPPFEFSICSAESYPLLKAKKYTNKYKDFSVLIPNDANPNIALHAVGGAGKTQILKLVFGLFVDKSMYIIYIDLKRYSANRSKDNYSNINEMINEIILYSAPRRTIKEIKTLVKNKCTVIIDGLDEIPVNEREPLLNFFKEYNTEGKIYIIASQRFGNYEYLRDFKHVTVGELEEVQVKQCFDDNLEIGVYDNLNPQLKEIYKRPFFVNLAIKNKKTYSSKIIESEIFLEFFNQQLSISNENLAEIALLVFKNINKDGILKFQDLKHCIDSIIYNKLLGSDVLNTNNFNHELWRDFFSSYHIVRNPDDWTDSTFDKVTSYASSLESICLTIEQITDIHTRTIFLQKIYDWNYRAAFICMAHLEFQSGPEALSKYIKIAILAATAEKKFDKIGRTRTKAQDSLNEHDDSLAKRYLACTMRNDLVQLIKDEQSEEDWFKQWKSAFMLKENDEISNDELSRVVSGEPLVGWATANAARRAKLTNDQQQWIRDTYYKLNDDKEKNIRWRLVHILGWSDSVNENCDLLILALKKDSYHWVKYGAARALIELASKGNDLFRKRVTKDLHNTLRYLKDNEYNPRMLNEIIEEIIESCFIDSANNGWKNAMESFLECILDLASGDNKAHLEGRIHDFGNSYQENMPA